jgi:hypothetical protein
MVATRDAAIGGVILAVVAAVSGLIAIANLASGGSMVWLAFLALAAIVCVFAVKLLRLGRGGQPVLGFDDGALYMPSVGRVPWADIERGWWYTSYRGASGISFDLTSAARSRLPLANRIMGHLGLGDLSLAGGTLPVYPPDLLERVDRHFNAATGQHLGGHGRYGAYEAPEIDGDGRVADADERSEADLAFGALLKLETALRVVTADWALPEVIRTFDPTPEGRDVFEDESAIFEKHRYEGDADLGRRGRMSGALLTTIWNTIAEGRPSDITGPVVVRFRRRTGER